MKIGINLLAVNPSIGGGYNYVINLLKAIELYGINNHHLVFYYNRKNAEIEQIVKKFESRKFYFNESNRVQRILLENTILTYWSILDGLDYLVWPLDTIGLINFTKPIVIAHDYLPLKKVNPYSWLKGVYLRFMLRNTMKKSKGILFISNTTASEFSEFGGELEKKKYLLLPNVVHRAFRPVEMSEFKLVLEKMQIVSPFLLYIGHLYPHKNHLRLLEAFEKFQSNVIGKKFSLVLRGDGLEGNDLVMNKIVDLKLQGKVAILPRLTSNELISLYSAAEALVFPSTYEGGGIPLMEAMACGCPIIGSDISATREFVGESMKYFNPYDADSICDALTEFFANSESRLWFRELALLQIERQRPEKVMKNLNDFFDNL